MLILIDGAYLKSSENRPFKGIGGNDVCKCFFSKSYNVINFQVMCVHPHPCMCV